MTDRIVDGKSFAGQSFNPYKFKATTSTAPGLVSGVLTTIPFDTIAFDTCMMFGTPAGAGANQAKIPVTGYYTSMAIVNFQFGAAAIQNPIISIRTNVNASPLTFGTYDWSVTANLPQPTNFFSIPILDVGFFKIGDLIDVSATFTWGGAGTVAVGGVNCYWAMHFLSS